MLSPAYVARVLERLDKLDRDSVEEFLRRLAGDWDFLRAVLDGVAEGVLVLDWACTVRYANAAAEVLLNRKRDEMLGKPVLECIESVDFYNHVKAALHENARVRNQEVGLYVPSDRILNVSVFPILRGGEDRGYVLLFADITRAKEERQRLRRAESVAALSSLTAGVAHEIKNPLGAIDIHLQLAEAALDAPGPSAVEDLRRYVTVVREEVDRLNRVVTDYLGAVRPLALNPVLISPNRVVEDLARLVGAEVAAAGLGLELDLDQSLPALPLDFGLLRQALLNLVKNAREALTEGHEASGSGSGSGTGTGSGPATGTIRLTSTRDGDIAVLEVADDGPGLERDQLAAIFEPYYTTKASGTGLGLTIVYRIAREHGGEVRVDSAPGKGTRVQLRLPIATEKRPAMLAAPGPAAGGPPRTVE